MWLDNGAPPAQAYLDSLQEEISFLREGLRRKDAITTNMTEAMKALPSPETAAAGEGGTEPRPWWRRFFGLD